MLHPQDLLLVLKILSSGPDTYERLGRALGVSASQAHAAAKRATRSGLLKDDQTVRKRALLETLLAVKHYFPAELGARARGIPTAFAAPPLSQTITMEPTDIPVWPWAEGSIRGYACEPIYKTAPAAAMSDVLLYEYLALIDALRIGRTREANLARRELRTRLGVFDDNTRD